MISRATYLKLQLPVEFELDEAFYLARNPDLAAAFASGTIKSAKEHFYNNGLFEGRAPNDKCCDICLKWIAIQIADREAQEDSDIKMQVSRQSSLSGIEFFQGLESLPYWRSSTFFGREKFISELMAVVPSLGDQEKIFVFIWLMANHEHHQIDQLLLLMEAIDDGAILPSLAKAVDTYHLDTGRIGKYRSVLIENFFNSLEYKKLQSGEANPFASDVVLAHAIELDARYNAGSKFALPRTPRAVVVGCFSSKPHVFVGLFGQMRFPNETLPKLCQTLRSFLSDTELSFGVATWDKQGARKLEDFERCVFVSEQLPEEIGQFCSSRAITSVGAFSNIFPTLGDFLRRRNNTGLTIDLATIERLCGGSIYSAIDPDDAFVSTVGTVIKDAFPGNPPMLNQGRMWNRIGKFREMLNLAEVQRGPVTDVVFLRPDLQLSGDLAAVFQRLLDADHSDRRIFCDYDSHAINISGVGDRIFMAKRESAQRIIDGERIMQKALRERGAATYAYNWLMTTHVYAQTLIYQHGCDPTSIDIDKFGLEIYRGRLTWNEIAAAATSDATGSPSADAREFLTRVLERHTPL